MPYTLQCPSLFSVYNANQAAQHQLKINIVMIMDKNFSNSRALLDTLVGVRVFTGMSPEAVRIDLMSVLLTLGVIAPWAAEIFGVDVCTESCLMFAVVAVIAL